MNASPTGLKMPSIACGRTVPISTETRFSAVRWIRSRPDMGHKDSQSAIWIGFVIAYFGMMGGLFSVAMDATNSVPSAIFGAESPARHPVRVIPSREQSDTDEVSRARLS